MAFFRGDFTSQVMQMVTTIHVVMPEYIDKKDTRVLYLLHGLSDNCSNWFRLTSLERYANEYKIAVVVPEVQRSMYTNMKYGLRYFDYVSEELPRFISQMFGVPNDREHRFVAGLSMGGYGALKCALTYPERYAGCAAFSSACDIQELVHGPLGEARKDENRAIYGEKLEIPEEDDLFFLAEQCSKQKEQPCFLMTCGDQDILLPQNHKLRDRMQELGFDLRYEEWEGDHTWMFWDTSLQLALSYLMGEKLGGNPTPLAERED